MKEYWHKVEDCLPDLLYISDRWQSSNTVLATNGEDALVCHYQSFEDELSWVGHTYLKGVTHWQPLELP